MGADKNSSRRSNLTYVPNSQPRIPTRLCQGHVVTMDLPTLGTNPEQSRSGSTTQEAKDLAVLQITRQTARDLRADRPRGYSGPSASYNGLSEKQSRTSSTAPSITDRLRWARGPTALSRTIRHSSTDRPRTSCNKNPPTKWIERKTRKNSQRTRRTPGQLAPRGLSTPTRWTVRQVRTDVGTVDREQECELSTTYPSMDLPNGLSY
jgi:hypothetical protein